MLVSEGPKPNQIVDADLEKAAPSGETRPLAGGILSRAPAIVARGGCKTLNIFF